MRRLMLLATSLGFGVVQLDVSVVNVAIKPIGADLGGGTSGLQWVVNAYTVAFAAFILSAGALGDRAGAKRVFVAGFALFTTASVACGLAPSLGVLIAFRGVQGVGAAILVPCSLALLTHGHPDPDQRARAVGFWAAGASVALALGPLVGGALTEAFSWRAIFFINAPIGLLGIALTLRHATETPLTPRRADLPGQVTAVAALAILVSAVIAKNLPGVGLALVLMAAFVQIERRAPEPMLPPGFLRHPSVAIGLLVNVGVYGLLFVFSLYFQRTQGRSALATGFAFLPMAGAVGVANVLAARVPRAMLVGGVGLAIAAAALLGTGATTPYTAIAGPFVLLGASVGLIVPAMTAALLSAVDPNRSGVASGTLNTARQTGSALGVALFGALNDLHAALAITAGLGLAIAVLAAAPASAAARSRAAGAGRARA